MSLSKRLLAIISILALLVVALPAQAQNSPGSGLSISPTLFDKTLTAGQSDKLEINLKNITSNKITANAAVYDFVADNETGTPRIITDQSKQTPNSIRKFVRGLEDIPLDVSEQKKVTLTLDIPQDTAPGAYYGVIRYKAVPVGQNAPQAGELSLSASVGSIVLVTVPGNLKEQVQLSGIHVYRGGQDNSIFFNKPTHIGVEVRNLGNSFSKPFGTVEIQNSFGKEVQNYQLNNTNPRGTVLPSSVRIFKNEVNSINQIGRYTITASVSYGSGSQVLTLKKTIYYIPMWLAIIILVVLFLLVFFVFKAYRRYRSDRKRAYRRK